VKLNVAQLRRTDGATESVYFSELFSSFQLGPDEYRFASPLNVALEITNTGKSLLVKGKLETALNVICSRCLKDFAYKFNFEFEDEFFPQEYAPEDAEDAFVFEKNEFSIDERICEHILLHLPMRFICVDSCRGLCPKCGADLNANPCGCTQEVIDPRLEILAKWKNKGV